MNSIMDVSEIRLLISKMRLYKNIQDINIEKINDSFCNNMLNNKMVSFNKIEEEILNNLDKIQKINSKKIDELEGLVIRYNQTVFDNTKIIKGISNE